MQVYNTWNDDEDAGMHPIVERIVHILPGLTGLWQVSGKNKVSFYKMVALDIKYANEKTLCLYLAILLKTPLVILHQIADLRHSDEIAKMPLVEGKLKSPDLNQNIPLEQA